MKNFMKPFLIAGISAVVLTSCSDDDDTKMQAPENIYEFLAADADLSNLKAAVDRAGLSATLSQSGNYTVFAPSNAAFNSFLQTNGFSNLNAVPVDALKEILLNHVLSTEVKAANVTTGYVSTLAKGAASSTRNLSMFINTTGGVKINGISNVTATDIDANNGVIHKVDAVIGLPTIVTHATANPNFTVYSFCSY